MRIPEHRWDASRAATLNDTQLLLYRSNLLGADLTVTNFGGGNTSAKLAAAGSSHRRDRASAVDQGVRR